MIIEIKRAAEETIIELVGRLDTTTAPDLDKTINQDIADVKNLVLDIKELQCISSARTSSSAWSAEKEAEDRLYEGD